ncbi:MAG: hypothetical protein ACLSFT_06765 [Ruminococcus callidus]
MDFRDQFRKMSDDVGKMAREVADTSKKATARARVRRMINSCNESLQTIYQEIGSRYYVENQCQPEEQYEGLFQQASDLIAQIDVLKSELAGLDNASICPECGSKVNDGRSSVRSAAIRTNPMANGKQRQKQQRLHAVQQEKQNRQSVRLASRLRLHRQRCMKPLPNRFLRRKPMPLQKVQKQKILHSKPVILHSEKWL